MYMYVLYVCERIFWICQLLCVDVSADSTIEARVVHLQDRKKTIASHVSNY